MTKGKDIVDVDEEHFIVRVTISTNSLADPNIRVSLGRLIPKGSPEELVQERNGMWLQHF